MPEDEQMEMEVEPEKGPPTEDEILHELLKICHHMSPALEDMWQRLQKALDSQQHDEHEDGL